MNSLYNAYMGDFTFFIIYLPTLTVPLFHRVLAVCRVVIS